MFPIVYSKFNEILIVSKHAKDAVKEATDDDDDDVDIFLL